MRINVIFFVLLLILCSCKRAIEFEIIGTSINIPEDTRLYLYSLENEAIIDSASIIENEFSFHGRIAYCQEYKINVGKDSLRLTSDYFWIAKGVTEVHIVPNKIKIFSESQIFNDYQDLLTIQQPIIESANQSGWNTSHFSKLLDTRVLYIQEHPESIYSAIILEKSIKNGSMTKLDIRTARELFESLSRKTKKSFWGKRLYKSLNLFNNLDKGMVAPNINIRKSREQIVNLHEINSQNKLICFWHSGCAGSTQIHSYLKNFRTSNPKIDLEIVNISINVQKDAWEKYSGLHDLKNIGYDLWIPGGRYSMEAMSYGANATPLLVLTDSTNRIVETGWDIVSYLEHIAVQDNQEKLIVRGFFNEEPAGISPYGRFLFFKRYDGQESYANWLSAEIIDKTFKIFNYDKIQL